MKKYLLTIPLATLAGLAFAGHATAHNASATPSCSGLSWQAVNFDKTVTNSIVVKVDGVTVHADPDFKASDTGSSPWSQTAAHTWSVVIDAPGTQYDKSFSGTWQACIAPTTTVPSSTTVVVTTTAPTATTVPDVATTVVIDPTTTSVAVGEPPVPTTVAGIDVVSVEPALPRTGTATDVATMAFLVLAIGFSLAAIAVRRR